MSDNLAQVKILIVDDQPVSRTILRGCLNHLGIKHVVNAEDGRAALAMLEAERFSLVITDLYMPRMNGMQFLQQIRKQTGTRDLPVIVVSGENEKKRVIQALEAGADAFVIKPFSSETLKKKIIAVLSKKTQTTP